MASSTVGLEHVAGDDHLHHLTRAFGNAEAALLAPDLLNREIGGERNAAVDLHARIGGYERHFRAALGPPERIRTMLEAADIEQLLALPHPFAAAPTRWLVCTRTFSWT